MRSLVNPNDRIEVSGNVKEAVDRFCNEVSKQKAYMFFVSNATYVWYS